MQKGILAIRDLVFPVKRAELMGYITWTKDSVACKWHIDIHGEPRSFPSDDPDFPRPHTWHPAAMAYHLSPNFRTWRDFEGAVFTGNDEQVGGFSVVRDETTFQLQVDAGCNPINGNRIEFGKRQGAEFDLLWTGRADVFSGDYDGDEPFRVETQVTFTHVAISTQTKDANPPNFDFVAFFAENMKADDFRTLPPKGEKWSDGSWSWTYRFEPV
jgi:hypothetical protein